MEDFKFSYHMKFSNGFQKARVCHSNTTQHSKLHQDKAQFYIQRANFDLKNYKKKSDYEEFYIKNNLRN
jgi:hypothetical protein